MSVNAIEQQWLIDYAAKNQVDINSIYLVQSKKDCSVFFDEEYGVCLK